MYVAIFLYSFSLTISSVTITEMRIIILSRWFISQFPFIFMAKWPIHIVKDLGHWSSHRPKDGQHYSDARERGREGGKHHCIAHRLGLPPFLIVLYFQFIVRPKEDIQVHWSWHFLIRFEHGRFIRVMSGSYLDVFGQKTIPRVR